MSIGLFKLISTQKVLKTCNKQASKQYYLGTNQRDYQIREELKLRDNHLEDQIKKRENSLVTTLKQRDEE